MGRILSGFDGSSPCPPDARGRSPVNGYGAMGDGSFATVCTQIVMRRGNLVLKPFAPHADPRGDGVQFREIQRIGKHMAAGRHLAVDHPSVIVQAVDVNGHAESVCAGVKSRSKAVIMMVSIATIIMLIIFGTPLRKKSSVLVSRLAGYGARHQCFAPVAAAGAVDVLVAVGVFMVGDAAVGVTAAEAFEEVVVVVPFEPVVVVDAGVAAVEAAGTSSMALVIDCADWPMALSRASGTAAIFWAAARWLFNAGSVLFTNFCRSGSLVCLPSLSNSFIAS